MGHAKELHSLWFCPMASKHANQRAAKPNGRAETRYCIGGMALIEGSITAFVSNICCCSNAKVSVIEENRNASLVVCVIDRCANRGQGRHLATLDSCRSQEYKECTIK